MGAPSGNDDTQLGIGASPGSAAPQVPAGATTPIGGREPADALPAGALVGEYQIERVLGEGGMGTVYGALHPVIGKKVAIKILKMDLSRDPALVRRFVDEARAVNKIGHPNIIDIFSFGQLPDGRQFFVMEFLEGETLGDRLTQGGLPPDDARRLLVQVCEALEAAHSEKVVHRDLKPDNIWIARPRHGDSYVKVLDFGIAKLLETDTINVTQTGVTMGTPSYMSPEQCTGQGVDHRTDIYAMGVLLYQVFAGRLPFEGRTFAEMVAMQLTATAPPPSKWKPVSPALDALILSCLQKDPALRPQSAAELGRKLQAALGTEHGVAPAGDAIYAPTAVGHADANSGEGQETRQGFASAQESAPVSRRRSFVLVAAVVGLALAVLGGFLMRKPAPAPVPPAPVVLPATSAPVAPQIVAPPAVAPAAPPPANVASPAEPRAQKVRVPSVPAEAPVVPRKSGRNRVDDKGLDTDNPFK